MELTEEQIRSQEIEALTWMPWWGYLMEDVNSIISQNEKFIHDINTPDIPTHSIKSIYASQVNCLEMLRDKPQTLIELMKPQK